MNYYDGLDRPYGEVVSPVVTPSNPTGVGTGGTQPAQSPLTALLAALLAPQQNSNAGSGIDFSKLLTSLAQNRDPVGYANKVGSLPSYAPGSTSPFNTGFFKSGAERAAIEAGRGAVGSYGGQEVGDRFVAPTLPTIDPDVIEARYGGRRPALPGLGGSHGRPLNPTQTAQAHAQARSMWEKLHPTLPWLLQ